MTLETPGTLQATLSANPFSCQEVTSPARVTSLPSAVANIR